MSMLKVINIARDLGIDIQAALEKDVLSANSIAKKLKEELLNLPNFNQLENVRKLRDVKYATDLSGVISLINLELNKRGINFFLEKY